LAFVDEVYMFWSLKNHAYPIGVDMGDDSVRVAQLCSNGKGIELIAGGSENRPAEVEPASSHWQRWAIEAIHRLTSNGGFRGRAVVATMPASEVFIDHIKMPKIKDEKATRLEDVLISRMKQKLPFETDDAMIKYVPAEQDNALVIATERKKIDRHLAIYEKANLQIKTIAVWPAALANSYVKFFGRRKTDIEAIVMLVCMEASCTNVVICRHKNLLFARSIPIGAPCPESEQDTEVMGRLVLELNGCRRQFGSMYRNGQIERLIFLSGQRVNKDLCTTIAKQMEMPAQVGDCLAAVEILMGPDGPAVGRRGSQVNWATAFGLSLS
jgi:hypothetical protein